MSSSSTVSVSCTNNNVPIRPSLSSNPPLRTKITDLHSFSNFGADTWFRCDSEDPFYTRDHLIHDILECLQVLEKFLDYWGMRDFVVPMLIYVDRYINQVGKLGAVHIFDIFFVSTVITIKVWEDKWITNLTLAKMFNMPIDELNINERNFLTGIDYDLGVTREQVEEFLGQNRREKRKY